VSEQAQDRKPAPRRVLWPQLVLLLGLLAYVGAAHAIQRVWDIGPRPVGTLPALALVLVPAAIWLVYFYLLDRYEPEPTHYVLSMFMLGALVAAPIASWVINDLFTVEAWIGVTPFSGERVAASFLVVGAAQELCKYVVVRYTVYLSEEFDEPADGIVYSTATGIGFATALNLRYVSSGVLLTVGALNVTITTLAHACFAGVVGYALGLAKFTPRGGPRQLRLALGLLCAIGLNGTFFLLQDLVVRPGMDLRPWRGLLLSGLFALAVFGVISLLMRRTLRASPAREG
jgi:RsiW-degrading membrane proteinase PrsW (M82 family)